MLLYSCGLKVFAKGVRDFLWSHRQTFTLNILDKAHTYYYNFTIRFIHIYQKPVFSLHMCVCVYLSLLLLIINNVICISQFLITQRKNVEWARRVLCALPEIDVGRVGVKGAKKYFEAKQPSPIAGNRKNMSY